MRRFYVEAAASADGGVLLDGRSVRTPARAPLILPNPRLATAVAEEWQAQGDTIEPRTMPLTGLANAAIDRIAPARAAFASDLARYGATDLICYRADTPPSLVAEQQAAWDPLLGWAEQRFGVRLVVTQGIVPVAQPPETVARLTAAVTGYDAFVLAGLSVMVTIGGSLVVGLAVAEVAIGADEAFAAVDLDEAWHATRWGEDALALAARAGRRAEFLAAARFLSLLT